MSSRVRLTSGRVSSFSCPPGKSQAFLWDTEATALALRVSAGGRKTFVFEARLHGATIRHTIGTAIDWPIEKARAEAHRLKMMTDRGEDPRVEARQAAEDAASAKAADELQGVTVGQAWGEYLSDKSGAWGDRHLQDHNRLASPGGKKTNLGTRGAGVTSPGPLFELMGVPLKDLSAERVDAWAASHAQRPATARLSLRLLKAFMGWCANHPRYSAITSDKNPASSRRAREALGRAGVKRDALLREQLPAWFKAVGDIQNPAISAYLKVLLLTGARPGEVIALQWPDINREWRSILIRDKVEGERHIPLTPYVDQLLSGLPRRGEWVFASMKTEQPAPINPPNHQHHKACEQARIPAVTLHGLRRSFKSLTEWLEIPAGVVAQLMGHKPSATAEKHYTVRPLDLLRVHHERIEAWILEQGGVAQ